MAVAIDNAHFYLKDRKWEQENIRDHSKIRENRECFLPWMIPNIRYVDT